MRCSFCLKSQDVVGKLISSPNDEDRAYICDECIAVCASILDDDREPAGPPLLSESEDSDRPTERPMTPHLLAAVEQWIRLESSGADTTEALAHMRQVAMQWVRSE